MSDLSKIVDIEELKKRSKKVNFNTPEFRKRLDRVIKEQEKTREMMKVDWSFLNSFYFTI